MNFLNPITQYIGLNEDVIVNMWFLWHFQTALLSGTWANLLNTTLMGYPHGVSLVYDLFLLPSIISLPIQWCCGPVATYNSIIAFSYIGTFVGMFLFLNLLLKDKRAAVIGSLAFTFSTFRLQKTLVGHIDLMGTEWLGFFLFFWYRAYFRGQRRREFIAMAVLYVLQAYTDYRTLLLFSFIIGILFLRSGWMAVKTRSIRTYLANVLVFFLSVFIGLIPFILIHWSLLSVSGVVDPGAILSRVSQNTPPLLGYVFPDIRRVLYLGWISLGLIGFSMFFPGEKSSLDRREVIFWTLLLTLFLILSMGNTLQFDRSGGTYSPLLPFSWFQHIPILELIQSPVRFIVCVQIAASVLVAFASKKILILSSVNRMFSVAVAVILAVLVVIQNTSVTAFPIETFQTDPLTEHIRLGPEGSVLSIPFGYCDAFRRQANMDYRWAIRQQMIHKRPLLGVFVSYIDEESFRWYEQQSLFRRILNCQDHGNCAPLTPEEQSTLRNRYGVRYVLIYDALGKYSGMDRFMKESFPDSTHSSDSGNSLYILKPN